MNDVISGSDDLRILGFEKKESWDLDLDGGSRFSELAEARPAVWGGCCTWWGSDGNVSQVRNCVSLLVSKNLKLKKVIKCFVRDPISCFFDSYMSMNIVNVLCIRINMSISRIHVLVVSWIFWWTYQLYGHLPPITKTIQVRRTRHAGHCWRSRDELISDVLLWTPTYGRAKVGRPAWTYIHQLCEDTGCRPEDLPEAMNGGKKWRERVRDIRASGTTWW